MAIHKLADVQTSDIGNHTIVWQFSIILSGAKIGDYCNINCHTFIENDVIIGNNVTIKSGVYIWDGVIIEDGVFLGPNVVFTNDLKPRSKKRIEFIKTKIMQGASIGANTTILAGITVGEFAMTGIGSVVTKNILAYGLYYGNPATHRGWIDEHGNKLSKLVGDRWGNNTGNIYEETNLGLKKNTIMNIPFLSFDIVNALIKDEIINTFELFFDSKSYVLGENTIEFEKEYAQFNNTQYCVGVSNGLDALQLSLRALNITYGDEVIVPSNTYVATVLAISYVGATPIFVEPRIDTFNIDTSKIEAAITNKTKAIIPVHLYGQCCEMDSIVEISQKNNIYIVEDNAQSQGALFRGHFAGSFGHLNATSFYPSKNLGAFGEAGAVTTNDIELANKIRLLRNYGSEQRYYNKVKGFNSRIDECQAAFLRVKLKHLNNWNKKRSEIATIYNTYLENIVEIKIPKIVDEAISVFHLYVIRADRRDELKSYLQDKGISTMIHYPIPPHLQEAYMDLNYSKGDFPIAEEIANNCLSLPLWVGMTTSHVEYISNAIKSFYGN